MLVISCLASADCSATDGAAVGASGIARRGSFQRGGEEGMLPAARPGPGRVGDLPGGGVFLRAIVLVLGRTGAEVDTTDAVDARLVVDSKHEKVLVRPPSV